MLTDKHYKRHNPVSPHHSWRLWQWWFTDSVCTVVLTTSRCMQLAENVASRLQHPDKYHDNRTLKNVITVALQYMYIAGSAQSTQQSAKSHS